MNSQLSDGGFGEKGNGGAWSPEGFLKLMHGFAQPNFEASCGARASIKVEVYLREWMHITNVRSSVWFRQVLLMRIKMEDDDATVYSGDLGACFSN